MNKIGLIIRREYFTRVRKRSFLIMTLLGPLLIAGFFGVVIWLSLAESEDQKMLVADEGGVYQSLSKIDNDVLKVDYAEIGLDEARMLFKESNYTSLLWIPFKSEDDIKVKKVKLLFKKQPSQRIQRDLENRMESILERLIIRQMVAESQIDSSVVEGFRRASSSVIIDLVKFDSDGGEKKVNNADAVPGFVFGILIYLFVMLFGVQVMRGVIEEKTNRIVEVIISSVRPFTLMLGKIAGVWLVSLTQFALWIILSGVLSVLVSTAIVGANYDGAEVAAQYQQMTPEMAKQMSAEVGQAPALEGKIIQQISETPWTKLILLFMFYFSGGYLLYAAMFAAVGSAVDSETDTQQFMLPVTLPLMLGYIVSFIVIENPDGPAAFWFSIIPFTSPIVMMVRESMANVPGWELGLSMFLLVATFLTMTWVAGRIYRTGILMYGKKTNYRELLKWVTYKG
ncbi:MAG: ABC transporter permease [Salibacteraceae bacterium]